MIFCDKIRITSVTINDEYGTKTLGSPKKYTARVENNSKLIKGQNGKEIQSNYLVILEPNVSIKVGDRIQVVEIAGQEVDEIEYEVLSVFSAASFSGHHKEVLI